jgi:guanylate kinase
MKRRAIILYGPPTSGKNTITAALTRADPRYAYLAKLKVGTGRSEGYQAISHEALNQLRRIGRLAVETHRYGNIYAVDRADIEAMIREDLIPVVHMGNITDLKSLSRTDPGMWFHVLLRIPREVCEQRSRHRGDRDTEARLQAWDETIADLRDNDDGSTFHLDIDTNLTSTHVTAEAIIAALKISNDC